MEHCEALARGRPELFDEPAEERKKGCAEKKKEDRPEVTPHWTAMRDLWIDFYSKRHNGIAPTFGAEAGRGMKAILKRLQAHASANSDAPWTQERAAHVFTHFLTLAYSDDWLSRHFRISSLSSHYDTIIQTNAPDQEGRTNKAGRTSAPIDVRGAAPSAVSPWGDRKRNRSFPPVASLGSGGAVLADLSEAYSKSFKSLTVKAEASQIEAVRMDTPNFWMLNAGRGSADALKHDFGTASETA